jgi:hypothetical protein
LIVLIVLMNFVNKFDLLPNVVFCPQEISAKMTREKTATKIAQIEYSARRNASAPVEIAS